MSKIGQLLESLSKSELEKWITVWSKKLNVTPKSIDWKPLPKKWGQCTSDGRITFNTELLTKETDFQLMVIVHELLHLRVPNHGILFKSYMNAYLPSAKNLEVD